MKRLDFMLVLAWVVLAVLFAGGCACTEKAGAEKAELSYQVLDEDEIPEEMLPEIQKRKDSSFRLIYGDGKNLYIGQGYGMQESDGYSIEVLECAEAEEAIYIHTRLNGPEAGEKVSEESTTPYIVLKLEVSEKYVIFEQN